jgi:hypothetical protein
VLVDAHVNAMLIYIVEMVVDRRLTVQSDSQSVPIISACPGEAALEPEGDAAPGQQQQVTAQRKGRPTMADLLFKTLHVGGHGHACLSSLDC